MEIADPVSSIVMLGDSMYPGCKKMRSNCVGATTKTWSSMMGSCTESASVITPSGDVSNTPEDPSSKETTLFWRGGDIRMTGGWSLNVMKFTVVTDMLLVR